MRHGPCLTGMNCPTHQGPRLMIYVWICYPTVLWVLYEAWTMSDRGGSPHRPRHDIQIHPWHTQPWPWISEDPRAWTMILIIGIVVQGWWRMYRYGIPLFDECYMKHELRLAGFDHPHILPHDFQLHPRHDQLLPWILEQGAWIMRLTSAVVVQGWWYSYRYAIQPFYECYMRHVPYLTVMDHPIYHNMTSNHSPIMLNCYPGYWNQELQPLISWVV
jgi:hypothetical protein